MKEIIEQHRRDRKITNEQARLMEVVLSLQGDDQLLANRIVAQGADPASIEYACTGKISPSIRLAHAQGPGSLTGNDKKWWLYLAYLSADESKESSLRERITHFVTAVHSFTHDKLDRITTRAEAMEARITSLPFTVQDIQGKDVRVYESDLGFAAAYWSNLEYAAQKGVYNGEPYIALGSKSTPLADLGFTVTKLISPTFGIL